jgi:hypothetical protein
VCVPLFVARSGLRRRTQWHCEDRENAAERGNTQIPVPQYLQSLMLFSLDLALGEKRRGSALHAMLHRDEL